MAHISSTDRVIEIGTGTGLVLRELIKIVRPVYGTDISREMLQRVKDSTLRDTTVEIVSSGSLTASPIPNSADVILMPNDMLALDLPAGFFDKILSLEVLRYIQDIDRCFGNVRDIMKPDALFVFSVSNLWSINLFPLKFWLRRKLGIVNEQKEIMQYFVTPGRLRRKLARAGFIVVEIRRIRLLSMAPVIFKHLKRRSTAERLERIDQWFAKIPFVRNFFDTYLVAVRRKQG